MTDFFVVGTETRRRELEILYRMVLALEYQQKRRWWEPDYLPMILKEARALFEAMKG